MDSNAQMTNKLNEVIRYLSIEQQKKLLKFVESLIQKPKKDHSDLLAFAGSIPAKEIELMKSMIEEGCENINYDEW